MITAKYITGTPEIARFDFTRTNKTGADKTAARINKAVEYLWNIYGDKGTPEAPILFASLTKNQKLDFLAQHLGRVINDAAITQIHAEQDAAADLAAVAVEEAN